MAAATAVTTVAPVVANAAVTNTDAKNLVDVAKKALAETYADKHETGLALPGIREFKDETAYLNSKNLVLLDIPSGDVAQAGAKLATDVDVGGIEGVNVAAFVAKYGVTASNGNVLAVLADASKLANYLEAKNGVKAYVLKKGDVSGKSFTEVVKGGNQKYTLADAVADTTVDLTDADVLKTQLDGANTNLYKAVAKVERYNAKGEVATVTSFGNNQAVADALAHQTVGSVEDVKTVLYLKSGEKVELVAGADALDFSAPKDKNGNPIDLTAREEQSVLDSIAKFDVLGDAKGEAKVLYAPAVYSVSEYVLRDIDAVENVDLGTVYTFDGGYTENGADSVNHLREITAKGGTYNYKGDTYEKRANEAVTYEVSATDKGYTLAVTVPVISTNDDHVKKNLQFRITGVSHEDLVKVMNDLKNANRDVAAGRFKRLDGTDRYQTAIAVSKEKYENKDAESVVIVGGNALLDGLCASPLASAHNASILLASPRSGLSQATLDEIGRVTDNKLYKKTVYVVGGYNSVPASVDKVLADKFGAVVVRLAGDDRYATSKQVAERLVYDKKVNGNVFYVGGKGAADAMSAAPVAATKNAGLVAPILVTKDKDLDQQTRNFLLNKVLADNGKSYVIGGMNTLGTAFYKDAVAIKKNGTVERISGVDRYATNVKVLNKFYQVGGDINTQGLFVASGVTKYLVDAQTSGALAAERRSPILLAGNKLTDEQVALLKKPSKAVATPFYNASKKLGNDIASNVFQVGGVVSADAMKTVVDKFGL